MSSENAKFMQDLAEGSAVTVGGPPEGAPPAPGTETPWLDPAPRTEAPVASEAIPAAKSVEDDAWLSQDELDFLRASPEGDEIRKRLMKRFSSDKKMNTKLEQRDQMIMELQQSILDGQKTAQENGNGQQKQGWEVHTDNVLHSWLADAERVREKFFNNQDDEALRAEYIKVARQEPAVREQLQERRFKKELEQRDERDSEKDHAMMLNRRTENFLFSQLGQEGMSEQSPIMEKAREKVAAATSGIGSKDMQDPTTLKNMVSVLATQLANAEINLENRGREGRGLSPTALRSLGQEEQQRRAASASAQRSAAVARGDVDAVFKQDLTDWMDAIGI